MQDLFDECNESESVSFLNIDVILTFESYNSNGNSQEYFELLIPISETEVSAIDFFNTNFFPQIVDICKIAKRRVEDLSKISTASNWNIFEETTNLDSLTKLGHSCKWFFGNGRNDLDSWELELIAKYNFGIDVDMSWIGNPNLTQKYFEHLNQKYLLALNSSK